MNIANTTKPAARRPLLGTLASAPKHLPFLRAAFAVAQSKAAQVSTDAVLKRIGCAVAPFVLHRGDAAVATTTDSGWAAELAAESYGAFLEDLSPYSGAARIIAGAIPATLGHNVLLNYPIRSGALLPAVFVGEGGAVPVRSNAFTNVEVGPSRKLASILTWTSELGQRSDAIAIFGRMLREEVAAGLDAAFFATTAGSASAHVGLLYNVTATIATTLGAREDLSVLAEAVATGGSGNVTFVTTPALFAKLRIVEPQLAASIDIVPSAALPAGRVIACDSAALIVPVDPTPEITASSQASLHMSDAAAELVSAAGAVSDPIRSLYQTGTSALMIVQTLAFAKSRSTAVAFIEGANWS